MFVLPRRRLQQMLDDLTALDETEKRKLAARLNRRHPDRMAAMWELILLSALHGRGDLTHEVVLPNGRRPDIRFATPDVSFVADITTLSDSGVEQRAGVERVWSEITRLARKYRLSGNGFSFDVGSSRVGAADDSRVEILLPDRTGRDAFVKARIEPFIRQVARDDQRAVLDVDEPGLKFKLTFTPGQQFATRGHAAYTHPGSLSDNPLANRLKDKSDQLRAAPTELPRGVIVCDGGSDLMRKREVMTRDPFSRRAIAQAYVDGSGTLDFVLLISVISERKVLDPRPTYTWFADLVVSQRAARDGRLGNGGAARLEAFFRTMIAELPTAVNDTMNVAYRVLDAEAPDMIGGLEWNRTMAKISSRTVMKLLAGQLSQEDFQRAFPWADGTSPNPFAVAGRGGRMIRSVEVEPGSGSDDDWLVFHFGSPDAAVAPFTVGAAGDGDQAQEGD